LYVMSDILPPGRFFGTSVGRWRCGPFELSESVYAANTSLAPHVHARAYLGLVVQGSHRETAGAQERHCERATVVFHPAAERHANRFFAAGGRIFRLEIDDVWLARLREVAATVDRPAEAHGGVLSRIACRIFSEFRAPDRVSPLMVEGLALEFATALVRGDGATAAARAPAWLRTAVDYLHAHATGEIRLDGVAAAAGVHPAHLTRVFRTHYGCAVGEYVRRIRIEIAARELATSQRTIAAIAADLGFADQSHFTRVFARITGLPPARYRRLHGAALSATK
jgi:AraC family transcriptional regulator